MESTLLNPSVPTTKRLPLHLVPLRTSPSAWEKPRAVATAYKRGKAAALVVDEATMEKPEKAGMTAEEVEKELEEQGYLEWREMDKCKGCGEKGGILELMECLEREAIMGEDEGKDPIDYHRRAHIFDKSSKIFQALNQLQLHTTSS